MVRVSDSWPTTWKKNRYSPSKPSHFHELVFVTPRSGVLYEFFFPVSKFSLCITKGLKVREKTKMFYKTKSFEVFELSIYNGPFYGVVQSLPKVWREKFWRLTFNALLSYSAHSALCSAPWQRGLSVSTFKNPFRFIIWGRRHFWRWRHRNFLYFTSILFSYTKSTNWNFLYEKNQ